MDKTDGFCQLLLEDFSCLESRFPQEYIRETVLLMFLKLPLPNLGSVSCG